MTRNPILKVLFTFRKFNVKSLLIGGQACIIYGAAEFSKDSDFVIFCESNNIDKLKKALRALRAKNIFVPRLEQEYLARGHACHFRCYAEPVKNLRIDILAKLRGCDVFERLWQRRFTVRLPGNRKIDVISLEDLVISKKTQRDKDWLMLNRLVENDIFLSRTPRSDKIKWWLKECRNPDTIMNLVNKYKKLAGSCAVARPVLVAALRNQRKKMNQMLKKEELAERKKDKKYWKPLIEELKILRHKKS